MDENNNNLLHYASNPLNFGSYNNTDILKFIFEKMTGHNQTNKDQNTCLDIAIAYRNKNYEKFFKENNI